MKYVLSFYLSCFLLFATFIPIFADENNPDLKGKKLLWIDSYHSGYEWSDGIEIGIRKVLKGTGVELHIHRMDTKKNNSREYCIRAGEEANRVVETLQPDLVIASDDNAQKYLVVPYLVDTDLPVVFVGVNWNADEYGYPRSNVTGMVEVDHINGLVANMSKDAKGARIGFLSTDVITARKIGQNVNERFFNNRMKMYMVNTLTEFKEQFLKAQEEVDMLIIYNYVGIEGWDDIAAEKFLARNTRIPTGGLLEFMERFPVYTMAKSPEEQGEYAAVTALKILSGSAISDFPLIQNSVSKLTVNLKMAKAAGIVLPLSTLKTAEVIGQEAYQSTAPVKSLPDSYIGRKVIWVDSYHQGYLWSDGIESGIREVFVDTGVELKTIRMDTKRNQSIEFGKKAGLKALKEIQAFAPDAIITSDDNAQKYLVVPHLAKTEIPVIFNGVNKNAEMYGYPLPNVTGMLEVEPIDALLALLRKYAKGTRVGYLCSNVETERKVVANYQKNVFSGQLQTFFVETMAEFKDAFARAQSEVDLMIIPNYAGIKDWDQKEAENYLLQKVRIPTGSFMGYMEDLVLFTMANSPEEQGNYAATTVLRVFDGENIPNIPIVRNRSGDTTVNIKMADAADIVIPVSTLKHAKRVIGQSVLLNE